LKCYIFGISINPKISLPHGCRSIGFATEHTWFGEFLLLIGRIVAAISFLSHSGSGIDSISSPGTFGNLPSFQSRLACSILALELETKTRCAVLRRSVRRRSARCAHRPSRAAPPRPLREDQHAAAFDALLADGDAAVDDIGGAFRVLARQRQFASGRVCVPAAYCGKSAD